MSDVSNAPISLRACKNMESPSEHGFMCFLKQRLSCGIRLDHGKCAHGDHRQGLGEGVSNSIKMLFHSPQVAQIGAKTGSAAAFENYQNSVHDDHYDCHD